MKFEFEVTQVPKSDSLVGATSRQNELRVRVEGEAVDLSGVGVHGVGGF